MGEVYEAFDTGKDRTVALKLLPPHLADDAAFRARFLREAQTVARLNDPHVIPVHDFGEIDGLLYLDMRIVRGTDLGTLLGSGPISPERAVSLVSQIASALDEAHTSGLLHRDVKPANILVGDNDFAHLVDFGIAQAAGATRLTATGSAVGSFNYMAPERFGDNVPLTPASDVYSLACVLFEAVTGNPPYPSTSIEQVISGHLARPIPATGTVLDPVIARGTAKNPAERYATCGEFAAAARAALAGERLPGPMGGPHAATRVAPVPAAGVGAPQTLAPLASHASAPGPTTGTEPRRTRTVLLVAVAVAAVTLLAGGVATWMIMSGTDSDTPADAAATSSIAAPPTMTVTAAPTTPATVTVTPSEAADDTDTPTTGRPGRGAGDLGLRTPISSPPCDGRTAVFVHSATTPGDYADEVSEALSSYPGARYLRTDQSCASLKQSENGAPIYAVYIEGSSLADTCATKARIGGTAYARRLDDTTPVGLEIC